MNQVRVERSEKHPVEVKENKAEMKKEMKGKQKQRENNY